MAHSHLQQLRQYLRPYQGQLSIGVGALLLVNGMGVFLPWYIKEAIDALSQPQSQLQQGQIITSAVVVLAVATVMMVIRTYSRIAMFGVGRQIEFDLKQRLFVHLLRLAPSYFGSQAAGDLITRSTSDVDNVRRLLGFAILSLANTVFAYSMTVPAMFLIDVRLSALALSVYPLMLLLVKFTSARLQHQQAHVQQALGSVSDLIQETMNGITLIKVYAQETNEQTEFSRRNRDLVNANLTLAMTRNWLFPSLIGMVSLSFLVLLVGGGPLVASGTLSLGGFSALTLYVERLVFPTALLGFTLTAYQRGQVSLDRIESILSVVPTIQDHPQAISLDPMRGEITARNLSFAYPNSNRLALDSLNFRIEPGQMVSVVGPIGSGKSTLANVLPHLLEVKPDQIWIDGIDLTRIQLASLRQAIGYVPQESFLFNTTMLNNIRYGQPGASLEEVQRVARMAQIDREIEYFPRGYDTLVGERGITLSGGQRQRTALARALLMDAPILILDDALSSVDNETAQGILQNLQESSPRKTVIFISHRLTSVTQADQILVMHQGKLIQSATHAQLLQDPDGLYYQLWQQQNLEKTLLF